MVLEAKFGDDANFFSVSSPRPDLAGEDLKRSKALVLKDVVFLTGSRPYTADKDLTKLRIFLSKMESNGQKPFPLERKRISLIGHQTKKIKLHVIDFLRTFCNVVVSLYKNFSSYIAFTFKHILTFLLRNTSFTRWIILMFL